MYTVQLSSHKFMFILVVFDLKILGYCLLNFFKIKTNIFFFLTFENLKCFKTLANVVVDEFIAARVGGLTSDRFCFGELRHVSGCCGIWHFSIKTSRDETFSLYCVNGKILLTGDRNSVCRFLRNCVGCSTERRTDVFRKMPGSTTML